MTELAPRHGALMVALEHRYYGPSNPFDDLATPNLAWLNSEQALGDIASFHQMISKDFELSSANKWVTWGGSYPGMMAAMARLRYPNLIHASVSSSSPMEARVDMVGYNDVVAHSMSAEIVGGSQACLNTIVEGHKTIGEKLKTTAGQRELETLFDVCEAGTLSNPKNQEQFAGDGVVYLPVQSNDPECTTPYCNIAGICDLFASEESGASPIDKLAFLSKVQHAGQCVSASYEAMITAMANPRNPERTWLYQTCSEWGFYQTCQEGSECPYTQGLHTLEVDYDICLQAFGIPAANVDAQIAYTNQMYGGNRVQGSRIMYPNGEIDPWHALGVLESPNAQEPVLMVQGASHHYWTHPSLPTDSDFVKDARVAIWNQVDAWLAEP
jgi:thymus-specific serine protease